jgi:hypothetical protein
VSEPRWTLIPRIIIERHRQIASGTDVLPDVLMLHPEDVLILEDEIAHEMLWYGSPPVGEVKCRQFYGMDILVSEKMTQGFFVVGHRLPIERVMVDGLPKSPSVRQPPHDEGAHSDHNEEDQRAE